MKTGCAVRLSGLRKYLINLFLRALNSGFLNHTPCRFGFIGNVDAFSIEHLRAEAAHNVGITVQELVEQADRYARIANIGSRLMVIENDGTVHDATVWDLHELRLGLRGKLDH